MRQTSCKRILILLINLSLFGFSAQAQDSSKAVTTHTPSTKKIAPLPGKKAASPAVKNNIQIPARALRHSSAKPDTAIRTNKPILKPIAQASDLSLAGQYEELLKNSWAQQGYKVVDPNRLTSLWKSATDSLHYFKKNALLNQLKSDTQAKQIEELKIQIKSKPNAPESTAVTVNKIEILGIAMNTSIYNGVVWGTILVLGLALAAVLLMTSKNSGDAKHHKQLYEDISGEYQTYKVKSKEKEQKLARELQTERNTIEELLAKKDEGETGKKG